MNKTRGNLFLIHWNQAEAEEHAKPLRAAGWDVRIETEDGSKAGKAIRVDLPDVVVIFLTRLPSHGRQTGKYLGETAATQDVPIIFVGGELDTVSKTRAAIPSAIFIAEHSFLSVVGQFMNKVGS